MCEIDKIHDGVPTNGIIISCHANHRKIDVCVHQIIIVYVEYKYYLRKVLTKKKKKNDRLRVGYVCR